MSLYYLTFTLHSDTAFGRGDGVAGFLDQEVQHDSYGCPYLGGKALKGMLVNECADILAALPDGELHRRWQKAARYLFGQPGSTHDDSPHLRIGNACLPADLQQAIQVDMNSQHPTLTRQDILNALTTIRRQTAIDETTGIAKDSSLRAIRVIVRETAFEARLQFTNDKIAEQYPDALMLLAASTKALRRVGTNRNRGLGRIKQVHLCTADRTSISDEYLERFYKEVQP